MSSDLESVKVELKAKKKKIKEGAKGDKFDPRGVQTLFRTLSRNHYNLLRMIDNKSSIILTMNSIIISLLFGAVYIAPESERSIIEGAGKILFRFSLLSMIFALFSMLPHRYLGGRFKRSIYRGSLYAGNYAHGSLESFKTEFQRILESGNSIYNEMIEDLYFLGRAIARKQKLVWASVIIFMIGLMTTFAYGVMKGLPF